MVLFVMILDCYKCIVNYGKFLLSCYFILIVFYFLWFIVVVVVSVGLVGFIDKVKYGIFCLWVDFLNKLIDFYIEKVFIIVSVFLFVFCCIMYFWIYRVVKK